MKIRYLLKKRFKNGNPQPIYVALYEKDVTELLFTKELILARDWSIKEGKPRNHTSDTFVRIEKFKLAIQKIEKLLEAQDLPTTPFRVKEAFLNAQREKGVEQTAKDKLSKQSIVTVVSLSEKWLTESIFKYTASTKKTIKQSIGQFQTFLRSSGQAGLQRQQLSKETIKNFERYLQEEKLLSNSTHGRIIKHLRWFLKTLDFDVQNISIRTHKKAIVALTLKELNLLEKIDVSSRLDYQRAKDLFLLGCYTGLRISDLKRLNSTRVVDGRITMVLQKNKKEVSIPLRAETKEILERYSMSAPKIPEQHLNRDIKLVCREAKIDTLLTVKTNVAGLDVEKQKPKYQLISSHTAGKTFISLANERFGMTIEEISSIVQKDVKTIYNHYLQLPQASAIRKMSQPEPAKMAVAK